MDLVIEKMRYYVHPDKMTWWVGVVFVASAILRAQGLEIPFVSQAVRPIIDLVYPEGNPATLFWSGVALVTGRSALEDLKRTMAGG